MHALKTLIDLNMNQLFLVQLYPKVSGYPTGYQDFQNILFSPLLQIPIKLNCSAKILRVMI